MMMPKEHPPMRIPLPPIHEPQDELEKKLRQCRDARVKVRLHLLVLIVRGEVSTRLEAAERLAQHRNTIGRWLQHYEQGGLEALLTIDLGGAPTGSKRLSGPVREALCRRLAESPGFSGYREVQQWLFDEYGLKVPYTTVHRWVRYDLKAKLKRPRPEHPKKKVAEAAAFAKQLDRCISLSTLPTPPTQLARPLRLWFQDESRLGLHLPKPRRLTSRGVKPLQPVVPGYESYWLYAAVEPATGDAYWLEMPELNSLCFETFLDHFSQHDPDSDHLLVLDNASAHTATTLTRPDNVCLLHLPPYSPELNPVERLWQDLKSRIDVFDQHVRTSLEALRDHVAAIINRYQPQQLRSLTGYPYIREALNAL
jgi:transposase